VLKIANSLCLISRVAEGWEWKARVLGASVHLVKVSMLGCKLLLYVPLTSIYVRETWSVDGWWILPSSWDKVFCALLGLVVDLWLGGVEHEECGRVKPGNWTSLFGGVGDDGIL